jgi:hypothetical protein
MVLWVVAAWADAPRVGGVPADARLLALDAIDSCVLRLNSDIDIGYDRIVARCPTLARRLDESGLSVWLPRDWRRPGNDLSAGGLRELREVVSRELTVGATARGRERPPGVESVPDILASLARSEDEHGGWWARTKVWLRNLFEEPEPAADEGWLWLSWLTSCVLAACSVDGGSLLFLRIRRLACGMTVVLCGVMC